MSEMRNFFRFMAVALIVLGALLLLACMFFAKCEAQDQATRLQIYAFKGLNTAEGMYVVTPDYARLSVNIDYSRYGNNTIGKRLGFDSLHVVLGADSIVGFGTYQRSNRQSCLVYATDTASKGYGCLWATPYGSDNSDSARLITKFWSIQNPTRFSQFNDRLYATNGQQAGIVWDGTRARKFPLTTPGMPDIIPLKTAGNLNGEYRYMLAQANLFTDSGVRALYQGTISPAIHVTNGQVLLRNFSRVIELDSLFNTVDSVKLLLARTKANPGPIDDNDTLWLLDTIFLKQLTNYRADTVVYTDNKSDASLVSYVSLATMKKHMGRDSSKIVTRRCGAPSFIKADSVTTGNWQIRIGALEEANNPGYAYMVTVSDTMTGLESDSSRTLWVGQKLGLTDSTHGIRRITIGLPRVNIYDSGLVMNVYRASQMVTARPFFLASKVSMTIIGTGPIRYDTTVTFDTVWTGVNPGNSLSTSRGPFGTVFENTFYTRGIRVDSAIAADWYLAGQVPTTQTQFIDSIRSDSIRLRGRFNLSTQPEIFSQTLQYRNKILGVAGSRIWSSNQLVDSQGNFGTNTFDDFDRNDGDFITSVWETQFGLRVNKNRKSYVLNPNGSRPELIGDGGVTAPLSHAAGNGGHFYLGDAGVYFEQDGGTLERTYKAGLISDKLNNFTKMPDTTKRSATGFWLPVQQQYIMGCDFPATANDTAYVFDVKSGGAWSTWTNMVPKFGCLYSKNSTLGSPPPSTFYYTKAGGKTIYTYGTQDYDGAFNNLAPMTYETPLLFSDPDYEQVDAVGLTTNGFVPSGDSVNGRVYDEKGYRYSDLIVFDSLGYIDGTTVSASWGPKFSYREVNVIPMRASYLRLMSGATSNQMIRGSIEALDILYRKVERTGYR